jgi:hypothetical protein
VWIDKETPSADTFEELARGQLNELAGKRSIMMSSIC